MSLKAPAGKRQRSTAVTGTIHLRLEVTSASRVTSIELNTAKQDIQRLASSQTAKAVVSSTDTILDDAAQTSDDDGLSQSLKVLLSKLDVIVNCIDALSEVRFTRWPMKSATDILSDPSIPQRCVENSFGFVQGSHGGFYTRPCLALICVSLQSVSNQIKMDAKLIELVRAMTETFAFLQDARSLPDKVQNLENSINDLLKQITECCYFVRQYTRPGLIGMSTILLFF